jgi:predicted nucleotidyltransferase
MHKTSRNNLKLNQRITKRLEQSIASVIALYDGQLIEVSMFGSFANGVARKFSSIDMLVILRSSDDRFLKRNADMQRLMNEDEEGPMIDPLVYTEAELLELIKKKESFIISILKESIVIWNDLEKINVTELEDEDNQMRSRYQSAIPDLDEIDTSFEN